MRCSTIGAAVVLAVVAAAALGGAVQIRDGRDGGGVTAGVGATRMLEKVLADVAQREVNKVVNAVGRYKDLGPKMRWSEALAYCEKDGGRLCTQKEYCPDGEGKTVAGGGQTGDKWAPVSDYHNEWVFIGSDAKKLCRSHTQVSKAVPAWGELDTKLAFRGNVLCCKGVMDKMKSTFPTWDQAASHCAPNSKRLCRRDEYCPDGQTNAPRGGTLHSAAWSAVWDDTNEWVSVGHTFPKRLLCKTHSEIAQGKAAWGKKENTKRGMVLCCDDTFDNLEGKITYDSAALYCKGKGKRLCHRDEMCPEGAGKDPRGGLRPGEAWAPVGDSANEWASVGVTHAERKCKLHTEALESKPSWGQTTGWRGHIMCCSGERAGAEEESGEEEESGAEESEQSESSGETEDDGIEAASGTGEEGDEESKVVPPISLEDVDLQKAEEAVKARESEQSAKAAATEQAEKRRKAAEEAAKTKQMKMGMTDEQEHKRKLEEEHKRGDLVREAAHKRSAKILEEAAKTANGHRAAEEQAKQPSKVWVNLPKQAELMGPGETVNSVNRIQDNDQ